MSRSTLSPHKQKGDPVARIAPRYLVVTVEA